MDKELDNLIQQSYGCGHGDIRFKVSTYIGEGDCRELVTEAVNLLHYLNYEVIDRILSGFYFLHPGSVIRSDHHVIRSALHFPYL